jgi:shikimate dehydrogenase
MPVPDRYAVIGHPIAHSRSPQIHRLFAQQCQQYMTYSAIDVTPEQLSNWVLKFFAPRASGLNVTVPHKQSLLTLPSRLSERARIAGALNTLLQDATGQLVGDNTDGIGLVRDLTENLHLTVALRVLLLGAGGAARGVIWPLLELKPSELVIANRDLARARALAEVVRRVRSDTGGKLFRSARLELRSGDQRHRRRPAGEPPPVPASVLRGSDTVCYDMGYGEQDTGFVRWAREARRRAYRHGAGYADRTGGGVILSVAGPAPEYRCSTNGTGSHA